jgi:hypothetical protein
VGNLDELINKFAAQVAVIRAAPYPFILAVAIAAGAIWGIVGYAYSTILASKNAQLELADRQLNEYKAKLSVASPDEAKSKIDALISEVAALRAQLQGRRLTPEQNSKIVEYGRPPQGKHLKIQIVRDMGASEGGAYANDFMTAFREAGGEVSYGSILFGAPAPSGVAIFVVDQSKTSQAEAIATDALRRAQVQFDILQAPGTPTQTQDDVKLWITAR